MEENSTHTLIPGGSQEKISSNNDESFFLLPGFKSMTDHEKQAMASKRVLDEPHKTVVSDRVKNSPSSAQISMEELVKHDPFRNPLMLTVFEAGASIFTNSPNRQSIEVDLNAWKKKYYLFGRAKEHLDAEALINL
jgi:hypothetical protein